MSKYASATTVDSFKTRSEIERTLHKYGAEGFQYGWRGERAVISFALNNRHIRFILPLPSIADKSITHQKDRWGGLVKRSEANTLKAYEQAVRTKWRALFLVIKAKLEAVESGITTLEDEFMAHIVLPGGQTVSDFMAPQIENAYATGAVPQMLMLESKS